MAKNIPKMAVKKENEVFDSLRSEMRQMLETKFRNWKIKNLSLFKQYLLILRFYGFQLPK